MALAAHKQITFKEFFVITEGENNILSSYLREHYRPSNFIISYKKKMNKKVTSPPPLPLGITDKTMGDF